VNAIKSPSASEADAALDPDRWGVGGTY
jgi:hypothetical protein